jgi:DNA repair exonuclease SbcCD ATPase subunit
MILVGQKKTRGTVDIKLFAPAVVIAFLLLVSGIYLIYKNERHNLLLQLKETEKQKEELNSRLNQVLSLTKPQFGQEKSPQRLILKSKPTDYSKTLPTIPAPAAERLSGTQKSLTRLKDYIKELETKNNILKDKVEELSGFLQTKENELGQLNKNNIILKQELDKTVNMQTDSKGETDQKLAELKGQLSQRETDFMTLNMMKANLENKVSELNNRLSSLAESNSYLEKLLAQTEKDKSGLEVQFKKLQEEAGKKVSADEVLQLKMRVDELTQQLNNKEQERLSSVKELEQLKESKKNLESELNELKIVKDTDKSHMSELNLSYESMKGALSQLSALVGKREIELSDKQTEVTSLKQNLEQIGKERDAMALALREKEKAISDLNAQIGRLEAKIESLQAELTLVKDRQKRTVEQLSEATSINSSLQQRLSEISRDLEPIQLESEPSKAKADELRKKVKVMLDVDEGKE